MGLDRAEGDVQLRTPATAGSGAGRCGRWPGRPPPARAPSGSLGGVAVVTARSSPTSPPWRTDQFPPSPRSRPGPEVAAERLALGDAHQTEAARAGPGHPVDRSDRGRRRDLHVDAGVRHDDPLPSQYDEVCSRSTPGATATRTRRCRHVDVLGEGCVRPHLRSCALDGVDRSSRRRVHGQRHAAGLRCPSHHVVQFAGERRLRLPGNRANGGTRRHPGTRRTHSRSMNGVSLPERKASGRATTHPPPSTGGQRGGQGAHAAQQQDADAANSDDRVDPVERPPPDIDHSALPANSQRCSNAPQIWTEIITPRSP
jgi:hypothetical protein